MFMVLQVLKNISNKTVITLPIRLWGGMAAT
jgi:hypothetical protein